MAVDRISIKKDFKIDILKKIYEGDISTFYYGYDQTEKRKVGIKVIDCPPKIFHLVDKEAKIMTRLSMASIYVSNIYFSYYDRKKQKYYIIMQLIENGESLRDYINKRTQLRDKIYKMMNIASVVNELNRARIYHRDLKPENIFLKNRDVFIIDFGMSGAIPRKGEGTSGYQAPEQDRDMTSVGLDKVDQFSLGVIFYEILIGRKPSNGFEYYEDDFENRKWDYFEKPSNQDDSIPSALDTIVIKLMSKNYKDRYKNLGIVVRELSKILKQVK